jgi:1-aminocyclopropane-1-carboxylate synthase
MAEATWEEERALWRRLLDEINVNLTPGAACRIAEPGFMRLCFASVPSDTAVHAVGRMGAVLRGVRAGG